MKKILAILLLGASLGANAATYTETYDVQRTCNQLGELGSNTYFLRFEKGYQPKYPEQGGEEPLTSLWTFTLDYAMKDALSEKDAYLTAWTKCMDVYKKKAKRK